MPKYTDEVKAKCVEAVKSGKSLTDVHKLFGPNVKAIGRYCVKAGVTVPKAPKAPKADKPKTDAVKPAAAPVKKN